MKKIAVLGAGGWGTALTKLLAEKGEEVTFWGRNPEVTALISKEGENKKYLPGVKLPSAIKFTSSLEEALFSAAIVVFAVPSQGVRSLALELKPYLGDKLIISAAKGFELETNLLPTEIIKEELSDFLKREPVILAGPSHAEEVGRGLPTAVVAASKEKELALQVQDLFSTSFFRVYTNDDVKGVELGGALKNIIALATGISDGLGFGDNARAALITRGMVEIIRLGKALGGREKTFWGLTGMGDLVVTANSMHSRNRRAGIKIGQGLPLKKVLQEMQMVVEGVHTTKAAYELALNLKVEMPITSEVYQVLFEGKSPLQAVANLMQRKKVHEAEDVLWGE
jgi:glycerol-3-phosphate dehydrogenase (NAD(P)+)